eukprot:3933605-Rhodomonas_salina.1
MYAKRPVSAAAQRKLSPRSVVERVIRERYPQRASVQTNNNDIQTAVSNYALLEKMNTRALPLPVTPQFQQPAAFAEVAPRPRRSKQAAPAPRDVFHASRQAAPAPRDVFHASRQVTTAPRDVFHASRQVTTTPRDVFHVSRQQPTPAAPLQRQQYAPRDVFCAGRQGACNSRFW